MSLSSPPQAVLHIGLPKTGTTALQQHFFPALPDDRFTYIGTDQPRPNRGGVAYRAIMDALNCPADIRDVRVYQAQAQLAQLPQQKTLVLSGLFCRGGESGGGVGVAAASPPLFGFWDWVRVL